jgi:hypothetical protein
MAKAPKKEEVNITPIDAKEMRLSKDGSHVTVGSRVFKRVVLPSSAAPKQTEADRLLDELDEESQ